MEKESNQNLNNIDWSLKDRETVEKTYAKGKEFDCLNASNSFVAACIECTKVSKYEEFTMPWHKSDYYRIMSCQINKKVSPAKINFFRGASIVSSELSFLSFSLSRRYVTEKVVAVLLQINLELFIINMNTITNILFKFGYVFDPRLIPLNKDPTPKSIKDFAFDKFMVLVEQDKVQWVLNIMGKDLSKNDWSVINDLFNLDLDIPGPNNMLPSNKGLILAVHLAKIFLKRSRLDFARIEDRITVGFCLVTLMRFPNAPLYSSALEKYAMGPIDPA